MKSLWLLLIAGLTVFCFPACKKDSSPQSDLIGKWNLQYIKSKVTTYYGRVDSVTATATKGDYWDFRSDGKVYSNTWLQVHLISGNIIKVDTANRYDTNAYHLISTKLFSIDVLGSKDTIQINQLTSNQLVIEMNYKMVKDSIPAPNPNIWIIWNSKYYFSK
jgi:hypothetical protein